MNNIEKQLLNINVSNSEKNTMLLCYINHYNNKTSYNIIQLMDMSLKLQQKIMLKDETTQVYPVVFSINEIHIYYIIHYLLMMYIVINVI